MDDIERNQSTVSTILQIQTVILLSSILKLSAGESKNSFANAVSDETMKVVKDMGKMIRLINRDPNIESFI